MPERSFSGRAAILGGCHFLASLSIVPFTRWAGEALSTGAFERSLMAGLHFLTKALYYPILSHALYPRHWFPGPWIAVPILVNSFLCGILLAALVTAWRLMRPADL